LEGVLRLRLPTRALRGQRDNRGSTFWLGWGFIMHDFPYLWFTACLLGSTKSCVFELKPVVDKL
jgi:hypothetical protein